MHPDRPQPGHGRSDGPLGDRRRPPAQRHEVAVRAGQGSRAAPRLHPLPASRQAQGRPYRGRPRSCSTPPISPDPDLNVVTEQALTVMASLVCHDRRPDRQARPCLFGDAELTVLLYEFRSTWRSTCAACITPSMRTLADLIAFNSQHCTDEMRYFGQELFELAEATTGLSDPIYRDARKLCIDPTRRHGIDQVMREQDLDAIVAPTYSYGSSAPAVAGYPQHLGADRGHADGRPGGIWMYGRPPCRSPSCWPTPTTRAGDRRPTIAAVPEQGPGAAAGCRPVPGAAGGPGGPQGRRRDASPARRAGGCRASLIRPPAFERIQCAPRIRLALLPVDPAIAVPPAVLRSGRPGRGRRRRGDRGPTTMPCSRPGRARRRATPRHASWCHPSSGPRAHRRRRSRRPPSDRRPRRRPPVPWPACRRGPRAVTRPSCRTSVGQPLRRHDRARTGRSDRALRRLSGAPGPGLGHRQPPRCEDRLDVADQPGHSTPRRSSRASRR